MQNCSLVEYGCVESILMVNSLSGDADLVSPMESFHNLLTGEGNQNAYDDDADLSKKLAPAMDRLRLVDIHFHALRPAC